MSKWWLSISLQYGAIPGWGPCSKQLIEIPIQTTFPYENTRRQTKKSYDPDFDLFVQLLGAFMYSLENPYEKNRPGQNAMWSRLWLVRD